MIFWGFVGSHLLHLVTDDAETLREDPMSVLAVWRGMSSYGGMMGGVVATLIVMRWRRMNGASMLRYLDCVAFVFPFAWVFGRLGCAVAHDHPGIPSGSWLAVQFPEGPRFDLGFLELLCALAIAAAFLWLAHRTRASRSYLAPSSPTRRFASHWRPFGSAIHATRGGHSVSTYLGRR
jgi:phosphatidylglycerol:prolipoprotein diacylglycerol transferase